MVCDLRLLGATTRRNIRLKVNIDPCILTGSTTLSPLKFLKFTRCRGPVYSALMNIYTHSSYYERRMRVQNETCLCTHNPTRISIYQYLRICTVCTQGHASFAKPKRNLEPTPWKGGENYSWVISNRHIQFSRQLVSIRIMYCANWPAVL